VRGERAAAQVRALGACEMHSSPRGAQAASGGARFDRAVRMRTCRGGGRGTGSRSMRASCAANSSRGLRARADGGSGSPTESRSSVQ
jgi:hypothetical protein